MSSYNDNILLSAYAAINLSATHPESASPAVRAALDTLPPLNIFAMLAHADSAFLPYIDFRP